MAYINVEVKVAWWVKPYLNTVVLFCTLTGLSPSVEKVKNVIMKGIKLKATYGKG